MKIPYQLLMSLTPEAKRMAECPKCGEEAKLIEAGDLWSSYYCGSCNIFFWERET